MTFETIDDKKKRYVCDNEELIRVLEKINRGPFLDGKKFRDAHICYSLGKILRGHIDQIFFESIKKFASLDGSEKMEAIRNRRKDIKA